MTLEELMKQLERIAAAADPGTIVRINGEPVDELAIIIQHPLERRLTDTVAQLAHDKTRPQVLDIAVNGREAPKLPVAERDLRRW